MNLNALSTPFFPSNRIAPFAYRRSSPAPQRIVSALALNGRPPGSPKPTLELARACAREAAAGAGIDSGSLLFLGGCAASVLAGCIFHMERFVAHFDTFENFVRALIA